MLNEHRIQLDVKKVPLGKSQLDIIATAACTVADLTGTTAFDLNADQKSELKSFIGHGGALLVDAGGSSSAFATSAEAAISTALGGTFHDLSPDHPILSGLPTPKASLFREFGSAQLGKATRQYRLLGMDVGGRTAVIFSRYDLANAIVGQPVNGVAGYTPAAATALLAHLLETWSTAPSATSK